MRISDWSSDVCSSDLPSGARIALRITFRDICKSRAIALIAFPPAYSRRIRTTVSKTNIPTSPTENPRSEEHTSELQSLMRTSYAVFCLKKQNTPTHTHSSAENIPRRYEETTYEIQSQMRISYAFV